MTSKENYIQFLFFDFFKMETEDVIKEDESDPTMEEHDAVSDECGSELFLPWHVSEKGDRRHGCPELFCQEG